MGYHLLLIQLLFALAGLFLFWQSAKYFRRMWQYKKLKAMPFPQEYKTILQEILQYKLLSPAYKEKIHLLILLFIDQKEFVGAKMSINNEIKVIIAFYACLMRLGFEERIRSSHHTFRKEGIEEKINIQKDGAKAKPYQVRQVRSILLRYKIVGEE